MLAIPDDLNDLRRLSPADRNTFVSAATASEQKSALYFFPFLCTFTTQRNRTLLWESLHGSICLYMLRQIDDKQRLHLYVPPFPFNPRAMNEALNRANNFNGDRLARIIWVDECQRPLVEGEGLRSELKEQEYIYDRALVEAASGKQFERVRRTVNKLRRHAGLEVRPYRQEDAVPCMELLMRWRRFMRDEKGREIPGFAYFRKGLDLATSFDDNVMRGQVVTVDERICALTFIGKITSSYGCIFITVSDHRVPGLGFLQRYSLMTGNPDIAYFNDSTDGGEPGLAELKRSFNPVEMLRLYRAVQPKAPRRGQAARREARVASPTAQV